MRNNNNKSSLFHHRLKSKQAGNSDKTMQSSRSTAPISNRRVARIWKRGGAFLKE